MELSLQIMYPHPIYMGHPRRPPLRAPCQDGYLMSPPCQADRMFPEHSFCPASHFEWGDIGYEKYTHLRFPKNMERLAGVLNHDPGIFQPNTIFLISSASTSSISRLKSA